MVHRLSARFQSTPSAQLREGGFQRASMIFVMGSAGFIGANFVLDWLQICDESVVSVDKLTYAGNLRTLKSLQNNPLHVFVCADICDRAAMDELLARYEPRA